MSLDCGRNRGNGANSSYSRDRRYHDCLSLYQRLCSRVRVPHCEEGHGPTLQERPLFASVVPQRCCSLGVFGVVGSPWDKPSGGAWAPRVSSASVRPHQTRDCLSRVLGLERMLRVHAKTVPASKVVGAGVSVFDRVEGACLVPRASLGTENTFVDGAGAAPCSLPGEDNLGYSENDLVDDAESVLGGRDHLAPSTAGESSGISGLLEVSESVSPLHVLPVINSLNSSLGVDVSACACAAAAALPAVAAPRSWSTVARLSDAVVAPAHASPMHRACSAGGSGGFLPVQKSTSYCLRNSWSDTVRVQGPTGTKRVKGGVSGLAEDLRPVTEVGAGVNLRPAGGVREQVAGSIPRRQPGTGTRRVREGAVTSSLHPEVPGIRFVSPGRGLDIRQSMGWTKVCETTRSGIWVLKGDARTRMLPENLDHLRVRWISRGTYETAWVTPGHDCLCSYQYGHGAAVRPQTNDPIWHGVIGLCGRRELPTGVNLNRYSGPSSCIRWHSDNEPLFGPQNSPKLIVSISLGNSVEFKVRRGRGSVPSLITLDHGDLLVMDGLTQSEYVHCTASGLQGPRVNLTFRWVAQHIASCPLSGVMGCVLPSCVQGLAEPDPRGGWGKGYKWSSSWGLVLFLLILVSFLLVGTLINIGWGLRYSGQRPSCSVVHFPSRGRARWVGGRRWPLSRRRQRSKGVSIYFPRVACLGDNIYSFFQEYD